MTKICFEHIQAEFKVWVLRGEEMMLAGDLGKLFYWTKQEKMVACAGVVVTAVVEMQKSDQLQEIFIG